MQELALTVYSAQYNLPRQVKHVQAILISNRVVFIFKNRVIEDSYAFALLQLDELIDVSNCRRDLWRPKDPGCSRGTSPTGKMAVIITAAPSSRDFLTIVSMFFVQRSMIASFC